MRKYVFVLVIALFALIAIAQAEKPSKCMARCRRSDLPMRFCKTFCTPKRVVRHTRTPVPGVPLVGNTESALSESLAMNNDMLDPSRLWKQYRTVLFDFFRSGDRNAMPFLQLVTTRLPAEWDHNKELLNTLVDRLPKTGATYEWSGRTFRSEYEHFLYNLQMPASTSSPEAERAMRQWEDKLFDAEMTIMDAEDRCMDNFDKIVSRRSGQKWTYDEFRAQRCTTLRYYYDRYDQIMADAEMATYNVFGPWFGAKKAIASFAKARMANRLDYEAFGDLSSFSQKAEEGQTNSFNVKVTSRTSVSTEKESSMNFGLNFAVPVYQIEVGVNYAKSKLDIRTKTDDFQVEVGAGGFKYIPVYPNREWFSPDVMHNYSNGPFKSNKNYFTDKGSMPLLTKGFFVMVKPKVSMYVSAQDAQEMQKTSQLGLNVSVMGIGFQFGKNDRMKSTRETDKLYKIEIEGNDPTPQIIAVDNMRLPNMS